MRIKPLFDPIFDQNPSCGSDRDIPAQKIFLFDGWSYQPLAAEQRNALPAIGSAADAK